MENQSYSTKIKVAVSPNNAFMSINDVSKWWAGDVEGQNAKLNDEFILRYGDQHYSKHKVTELIPGEKIAWLVTDSKLNWMKKNKDEWTGTTLLFEISGEEDEAAITFTHQGLVPGMGCYENCEKGWDSIIKTTLYKYVSEGKAVTK